jgi:hypothetical protein
VPILRDAASHVAAILRVEDYATSVKYAASMDDAFDNIEVFESMLDSELCVFVGGAEVIALDCDRVQASSAIHRSQRASGSSRCRHEDENEYPSGWV